MNKKQITTVFAVCVFAASLSQAAVVTWDGGTGNWGDANWTVDGTPGELPTILNVNGNTPDQYTIGSGTVTRSAGLSLNGTGPGSFTLGSGATYITGGYLSFANNSSGLLQGTVNSTAQLNIAETTGGVVIDGADATFAWVGVAAVGGVVEAQSGSLTVTAGNGFRFVNPGNLTGGALIDFTGGSFSFTITQTDNTWGGRELATKAVAGFFGINGTQVATTNLYDGTNLATVNADLQAAAVDGLYFQITENAGTQTLRIVEEVIPGTPVDLSIAAAPGGVELSFLSKSSIAYLIETTSDLQAASSWTTLTNVTAVVDETTVAVDTTGEPVGFFRAEVQ